MEKNTEKAIAEITAELVMKALFMLPKTITYRVGDTTKTYELRITADKDGYGAYYFHNDLASLSLDRSIYMTKGDSIAKVICDIYEKVLRCGDINRLNEVKCEGCKRRTSNCVKVYNANNTTTCINTNDENDERF